MRVFFIIVVLFIKVNGAFAQNPDTVALPSELKRVLTDYETYWTAGDEAGLAGLFTEDGYILRTGHPPTQGREAIQKAYANAQGMLVLRAYDYGISGNLGYIIGGYAGHPSWPSMGKFTLVLKKVGERWLIHSDMDNRNQARED